MIVMGWEEEFSVTTCFELPQYSAPINDGTAPSNTFHIDLDRFIITQNLYLKGERPERTPVSNTTGVSLAALGSALLNLRPNLNACTAKAWALSTMLPGLGVSRLNVAMSSAMMPPGPILSMTGFIRLTIGHSNWKIGGEGLMSSLCVGLYPPSAWLCNSSVSVDPIVVPCALAKTPT